MLNKTRTLYGHYIERFEGIQPLSMLEFLQLPYHERLRQSGCKIFLKRSPCCSKLSYPLETTLELSPLPSDMSEFRKDDLYLLGTDKEFYPVFPFEYVIIYPDAEIEAGNFVRSA